MKFGLREETITKINAVFINHPKVEQVIIYGSRAKGSYRNGSDIDITLFGAHLTHDDLSTISLQIDDLNTPYLFDISIFSKLNAPDLEEHIKRVGKIFFTR